MFDLNLKKENESRWNQIKLEMKSGKLNLSDGHTEKEKKERKKANKKNYDISRERELTRTLYATRCVMVCLFFFCFSINTCSGYIYRIPRDVKQVCQSFDCVIFLLFPWYAYACVFGSFAILFSQMSK